jgi:hypothetical protein
LASEASMILQQHDEWMMQCEEANHMDTGDALDRLAALRALAERVLNEAEEL